MIFDPKAHLNKNSPEGTGASLATAAMGDNLAMDEAASADARYRRVQLWIHRLSVLLFVFVCATVGVLLVIFPWHPEWTDNRLLLTRPGLRSFVTNSFVRGVCSGLGLLDIWIGFWEAIHYHEEPRPE